MAACYQNLEFRFFAIDWKFHLLFLKFQRKFPPKFSRDAIKWDYKQFLYYSRNCNYVETLLFRCWGWWRGLFSTRAKLHLVSERWKLWILRQMWRSLPQTRGDPFARELYKLCFLYSWESCGLKEGLRVQSRMVSDNTITLRLIYTLYWLLRFTLSRLTWSVTVWFTFWLKPSKLHNVQVSFRTIIDYEISWSY